MAKSELRTKKIKKSIAEFVNGLESQQRKDSKLAIFLLLVLITLSYLVFNEWNNGISKDPLFITREPIKKGKWTAIVIYSVSNDRLLSNVSVGDLGESPWHFVIGNGNGIGDGVVFCGDHWIDQRLSSIKLDEILCLAPATGKTAESFNINDLAEGVLVIGLVVDVNRASVTTGQKDSLSSLVHRLQDKLSIPVSKIYLDWSYAPVELGSYWVRNGDYISFE